VVRRGAGAPPGTVAELAGKQVVVQNGDIMDGWIPLKNVDVATVETTKDALNELAAGEHDCAIVPRIVALNNIERYKLEGLVVGKRPLFALEYCFMTRSGQNAVHANFNEGLKALEHSGELRKIRNKWLGTLDDGHQVFLRIVKIIGFASGVLLVCLAAMVLWSWSLRHQVAARTGELRASEGRLAATLQSIGDGVISCDTEGKVVDLNATTEMLTGWSAAAAAGQPITEVFNIVHAQSRETVDNPVWQSLRDCKVVALANHTVLIARDGSEHHIADSCAPIRHGDGPPVGAVLVFRDVTESYLQREQLQESEQRFSQLARASRTMVWEMDLNGLYTYASDMATEVFGYRPEELVGTKHFYDLHPEDGREQFKQETLAMMSGNESVTNFENRMLTKSGEVIWVNSSGIPLFDAQGRLTGYRGGDTDITVRKQVEQELRQATDIVENIQIGLHIYHLEDLEDDRTLRMVAANPASETLSGVKVDDIIGNTLDENFPLLRAMNIPQRYAEVVRTGVAKSYEDTHYGDDRVAHSVFSVKAFPLPNNRVGVAFDNITARKQVEDELIAKNAELEQQTALAQEMAANAEIAAAVKGQFLANMSHELRTPLNGIIAPSEMLLNLNPTSDQRELAEIICSSGRHLLKLVNDILDFSKIEAGKLRIQKIPCSIREISNQMLAPLALKAKGKGLQFDIRVDDRAPQYCLADPLRVGQVLMNLVGNAVKFTTAGHVDIDVALIERRPGTSLVKFSVTDTGIGILPNDADALFEPFNQGDNSSTRKFGGTGLGLSISKRLVELMDGEIGVQGEPGKGAKFWFSLPLADISAQEWFDDANADSTDDAATRMLEQFKVLVVEDNQTNLKVAVTLLRSLGVTEVATAENGALAIDILSTRCFDLVLMDCRMPVLDGYETTRVIRDPSSPVLDHQVRIVGMTANAMSEDRGKCLDTGMDDYLAKPVSAAHLRTALLEVCV